MCSPHGRARGSSRYGAALGDGRTLLAGARHAAVGKLSAIAADGVSSIGVLLKVVVAGFDGGTALARFERRRDDRCSGSRASGDGRHGERPRNRELHRRSIAAFVVACVGGASVSRRRAARSTVVALEGGGATRSIASRVCVTLQRHALLTKTRAAARLLAVDSKVRDAILCTRSECCSVLVRAWWARWSPTIFRIWGGESFAAWRSAVASIVQGTVSPGESAVIRLEHSRVAKLASSEDLLSPIEELQISAGWFVGELLVSIECRDFGGALRNGTKFCDNAICRVITEFLADHSDRSTAAFKGQLSDVRKLLAHEEDWLISALALAREWALTPSSPIWCAEPAFVVKMAEVDGWRRLGEAT